MSDAPKRLSEPSEGNDSDEQRFPFLAGVLLGLGLGGFFDGIVLHQILQWHHIASSAGHPPVTLENLEWNTLLDGIFHAVTYLFTATGLFLLWREVRKSHFRWPSRLLLATMLIGFGAFNLVEGAINHHILGLHHVNETVLRDEWIYWDIGFLAWGGLMFVVGAVVYSSGIKAGTRSQGDRK